MSYLYRQTEVTVAFISRCHFLFHRFESISCWVFDIRHLFLISKTKSLKIKVKCSKPVGKAVILTIIVTRPNGKYNIIFT